MNARWLAFGSSAVLSSLRVGARLGPRAMHPTTRRSPRRSRAGVAFLKEAQSDEGHWDEPSQRDHRLGMTALAGLALLENGVARDAPAISRAREVVVELARDSDQTYDLALAILFLARCQQGRARRSRRAHSDLGTPSGRGRSGGHLDLHRAAERARDRGRLRADRAAASAARRHEGTFSSRGRGTTRTRSSHSWASGRRAGTGSTRISRWNRSIAISARRSFKMAAGAIGWACPVPIRCRAPA